MNGVDYDIDWDCIEEIADDEEVSELESEIYGNGSLSEEVA